MHKFLATVVTAAALLAAAATTVQAQETDAVGKINVSAKPGSYSLAPQEFTPYESSYKLDTGEQIVLRRQVGRYFVHLKGENEVEIYGTAPGAFASNNGLRLDFRDEGDTVLLRGLAALPGAAPTLAGNDVHVASR
jgi:hypothetical protein